MSRDPELHVCRALKVLREPTGWLSRINFPLAPFISSCLLWIFLVVVPSLYGLLDRCLCPGSFSANPTWRHCKCMSAAVTNDQWSSIPSSFLSSSLPWLFCRFDIAVLFFFSSPNRNITGVCSRYRAGCRVGRKRVLPGGLVGYREQVGAYVQEWMAGVFSALPFWDPCVLWLVGYKPFLVFFLTACDFFFFAKSFHPACVLSTRVHDGLSFPLFSVLCPLVTPVIPHLHL